MISSTSPYNNYSGNGSTTQFDFDFYIESESQLKVLHTNSSGVQTTLTLGTDYSINEIQNKNGSYITFPLISSSYSTLASSEVISLVLDLPITQECEYGTSSELDLENVEKSFDKLTRIAQIQDRKIERALRVIEGSYVTPEQMMTSLQQAETNAANSATAASSSATSAASSANTASSKATLAQEWATKTDGKVADSDYSAKYYANSCTSSVTSASNYATAAQNWATKMDGAVSGSDYSAKYYANSISDSASSAASSASSASSSATAAQNWATKTDGAVSGSDYSAKYYANSAANSASSASSSASSASTSATSAANNASSASTSATAAAGSASSASTSATAAQNWAIKMDGKVEGNDYSAKYWAKQAQDVGAKDSEITLTQGGSTIGTFTLNQATDKTIDIPIASTVDDLNDLDDVTLTNVQNGQVLKYDSTSQKFVNASDNDTTYTAGTGISKTANNEFDIMQNDFGSTVFEIKGTLTESDGVYSGFSNLDYIEVNRDITIGATDDVEIVFCGTTTYSASSSNAYCYGGSYCGIYLQYGNYDSLQWYIPGEILGIQPTGSINIFYSSGIKPKTNSYSYFKLKRSCTSSSTIITLYYSSDGVDWIEDTIKTYTDITYRASRTGIIKLGQTGGYLGYWNNGNITLNKCSMKINGEYVWNPSSNVYKEAAKATNSLYGLVKPDGSTIVVNDGVISSAVTGGDGIMLNQGKIDLLQSDFGSAESIQVIGNLSKSGYVYSGFSTSNYLQIPSTLTLNPTDSFEMVVKFKASYYSSGQSALFTMKNTNNTYHKYRLYSSSPSNGWRFYRSSRNGGNTDSEISRYYINGYTSDGYTSDEYRYIKIVRTIIDGSSTKYQFYGCKDGVSWVLMNTTTISELEQVLTFDTIYLGYYIEQSTNYYLKNGTIDLSGWYIKKNGEYWWNPANNSYKPVAKATTSLYGLVKPDGTSVTVNDGVISAVDTTYTVGTGLNMSNEEFSICQQQIESANFEVVGSPTITDKVVSGFSDNDYISVTNQLNNTLTSFEIVTAISISQYGDNSGIIDAADYTIGHSIRFSINSSGKARFRATTSGTETYAVDIVSTNSIVTDTKTFLKVTYNSSTGYVLYLSSDGETWTQEATSNVTSRPFIPSGSVWRLGDNSATGYSLNGSLYLADTYIKVNNKLVWKPYSDGNVAIATNNLYGLVKPDNNTITVNNGVISADIAAYLQSVSGYDGTAVQTLQHDADGNLSWV